MAPANGGIAAPNIKTELVALAAMTVGGWTLTTKPLQRHALLDPHYCFWVEPKENDSAIHHSWSTHTAVIALQDANYSIEAAIATAFHQHERSVRDRAERRNEEIAKALKKLTWQQVQQMHGVTPYIKQNVLRMKLGKIRLWRDKQHGFHCPGERCGSAEGPNQWGTSSPINDIFSLTLTKPPTWLTEWGRDKEDEYWDYIHQVAAELWILGCAAVITAIWRWKVTKVHSNGYKPLTEAAMLQNTKGQLLEAYRRYQLGLLPLTAVSRRKIDIAEQVRTRWERIQRACCGRRLREVVRGFGREGCGARVLWRRKGGRAVPHPYDTEPLDLLAGLRGDHEGRSSASEKWPQMRGLEGADARENSRAEPNEHLTENSN
ncbi:hypothetical protein GQ600_2855 [Phytophthora cactorum]|nr:hypothetical protein GQ600_2855 [Phytophthora cactorum]